VRTLLYDPPRAGGLLISVAEGDASRILGSLADAEVEVGAALEKQSPLIRVEQR
jgi:selenophosphate synthase